MQLTLAVEPFARAWPEVEPLAETHWFEVINEQGHTPAVDADSFAALDEMGRAMLMVARSGGAVVGYVLALIVPHPHATGLRVAEVNALYLMPELRQGTNAQQMIRRLHQELAAVGVQRVYQAAPISRNCGALFKSMGYEVTDVLWSRRIDQQHKQGAAHG